MFFYSTILSVYIAHLTAQSEIKEEDKKKYIKKNRGHVAIILPNDLVSLRSRLKIIVGQLRIYEHTVSDIVGSIFKVLGASRKLFAMHESLENNLQANKISEICLKFISIPFKVRKTKLN